MTNGFPLLFAGGDASGYIGASPCLEVRLAKLRGAVLVGRAEQITLNSYSQLVCQSSLVSSGRKVLSDNLVSI